MLRAFILAVCCIDHKDGLEEILPLDEKEDRRAGLV
jgi:hypothetical protein